MNTLLRCFWIFLTLKFACGQQAAPGWSCNLIASSTPGADSSFRQFRWCQQNDTARANAIVPEFGSLGQVFVVVGDRMQNNLDGPVDLAFKPNKPCELWVLNKNSDSVSIFFNPGTKQLVSDYYRGQGGNSFSEWRQDNNACHFMAEPNALAFGGIPELTSNPDFAGQDVIYTQDGTFVTVHDSDNGFSVYSDWVLKRGDTINARYGGNFMGPTLWPADLESFAIKNNDAYPYNVALIPEGSHLSMLHQAPFGAGVAYSGPDATYYMWDGGIDSVYGAVTKVNFREDHGYGGFRHRVAAISRFHGTDLVRVPNVPGHMVLVGDWLYISDTGNGRVVRLDVTSGSVNGSVMEQGLWREGYDSYNLISDSIMQNVVEIPMPVGLALSSDGERLFVSDRMHNEIYAISLLGGNFGTVLERIRTPAHAISGLEIDAASGRLYYVDYEKSELVIVNPICSEEAGCSEESPFAEVCDTVRDNNAPVDENGLFPSIYEPLADPDAHFGGCGREYYLMCPGGNPLKEPGGVLEVCKAVLGETCLECCNRETGECQSPVGGGGGGAGCTFSDEMLSWTLLRYACDNQIRFPTLERAQEACCSCGDDCGGVTYDTSSQEFTIRKGSYSANGMSSWSRPSASENSWHKTA